MKDFNTNDALPRTKYDNTRLITYSFFFKLFKHHITSQRGRAAIPTYRYSDVSILRQICTAIPTKVYRYSDMSKHRAVGIQIRSDIPTIMFKCRNIDLSKYRDGPIFRQNITLSFRSIFLNHDEIRFGGIMVSRIPLPKRTSCLMRFQQSFIQSRFFVLKSNCSISLSDFQPKHFPDVILLPPTKTILFLSNTGN